jgi:hypothetical protein
MTKEPEAKGAPNDRGRHREQTPGPKPREQNLEGKALKMNDNSVGGKAPTPHREPSGDKPNAQKTQGRALEINENSVSGKAPTRKNPAG